MEENNISSTVRPFVCTLQVLRGLAFLNSDANLRHNSLHGDAIFVTKAGDWKLFCLDRMTSTDLVDDLPAASLASLQKYDPPEVTDHAKRRQSTPWSRDMWGVGCVVWEVSVKIQEFY